MFCNGKDNLAVFTYIFSIHSVQPRVERLVEECSNMGPKLPICSQLSYTYEVMGKETNNVNENTKDKSFKTVCLQVRSWNQLSNQYMEQFKLLEMN